MARTDLQQRFTCWVMVSPEEARAHHDACHVEQRHAAVDHVGVLHHAQQHQGQQLTHHVRDQDHGCETQETPRLWEHPHCPGREREEEVGVRWLSG